MNSYFHLRRENQELARELAVLRNRLDGMKVPLSADDSLSLAAGDSSVLYANGVRQYEYFSAKVVNNTITRQENYITVNRGAEDGMMPDMALICDGGIVGYILGCSDHFSVCMSVLNGDFRTSGRIKRPEYFGSIYWDGGTYEYVTLSEVPKYAPLHKGDTIVTTAYSTIFPPEVKIGTVESFALQNATFYNVKVKLHSNIAALDNVLVVKYLDADERNMLEEGVINQTDGEEIKQ